jgi:hypothetical protein
MAITMVKWLADGIVRAFVFALPVWISPDHLAAQINLGILPVIVSQDVKLTLAEGESNILAADLNQCAMKEFSAMAEVTKLSKEHILLLTKDLRNSDAENLDEEAYKAISKKENLQYLVQCSTGTIYVSGNNVTAYFRITIIDGMNGKVYWDKQVSELRQISGNEFTGKTLLNEVYKPLILELTREIKTLKF